MGYRPFKGCLSSGHFVWQGRTDREGAPKNHLGFHVLSQHTSWVCGYLSIMPEKAQTVSKASGGEFIYHDPSTEGTRLSCLESTRDISSSGSKYVLCAVRRNAVSMSNCQVNKCRYNRILSRKIVQAHSSLSAATF